MVVFKPTATPNPPHTRRTTTINKRILKKISHCLLRLPWCFLPYSLYFHCSISISIYIIFLLPSALRFYLPFEATHTHETDHSFYLPIFISSITPIAPRVSPFSFSSPPRPSSLVPHKTKSNTQLRRKQLLCEQTLRSTPLLSSFISVFPPPSPPPFIPLVSACLSFILNPPCRRIYAFFYFILDYDDVLIYFPHHFCD